MHQLRKVCFCQNCLFESSQAKISGKSIPCFGCKGLMGKGKLFYFLSLNWSFTKTHCIQISNIIHEEFLGTRQSWLKPCKIFSTSFADLNNVSPHTWSQQFCTIFIGVIFHSCAILFAHFVQILDGKLHVIDHVKTWKQIGWNSLD